MSAKIWVRVQIVDGQMNVQENVPPESAIAILEGAKLLLLQQLMKAPTVGSPAPSESSPAETSTRSGALGLARTVA